MIVTILATIGVLGLLILVHELGHFVAARWFDVGVARFSIGLGPRLLGFRRGETEYRIGAIPLGGYVKLLGMKEMALIEGRDDPGSTDPARTFAAKPAHVRAIILAAGVAMNALVAVLIFALIAMVWGAPVPPEPVVGGVVEEWLPEGAAPLSDVEPGSRITRVGGRPVADLDEVARALMAAHAGPLTLEFRDRPPVTILIPDNPRERQFLPVAIEPVQAAEPVIGRLVEDGAAHSAGLRAGDRVLAVDDRPIDTWHQLTSTVERYPGSTLALEIRREDGSSARLRLTPDSRVFAGRTVGRLGAAPSPSAFADGPRKRMGPTAAVGYGAVRSWDMVTLMGSFVSGLFDGRHSTREIGGPLMIGQLSGAAARSGLPTLLMFTALLSVNLAVINMLPIPALDGGHLMLLAIETVRGRPTPERVRLVLGRAGTAMVVLLMAWAVTADLLRWIGA